MAVVTQLVATKIKMSCHTAEMGKRKLDNHILLCNSRGLDGLLKSWLRKSRNLF